MAQPVVHPIPADLERRPDPYRWLGDLRDAGPVHRVQLRDGVEGWLVTRYDDVITALTDPRMSSSPRTAARTLERAGRGARISDGAIGRSMLLSDPPAHTRLRRLVSRAFTARRVDQLRPRVQEIADELLDRVAARGHVDLVAEYAFPLPVSVICEVLGVPAEDRDRFRAWSTELLIPPVDKATAEVVWRAQEHLRGYLGELVAAKRRDRTGDDLLAALVDAGDEQRLSDEELVGMGVLLLIAGHETTVNLIGTGMLVLLRRPDQLAAVRADPGLLPGAIEEFLRFDGPILSVLRYTGGDVEIGGVSIPAGEVVMLSLGAANRDPARFERPEVVDLGRPDNQHVAFGHGIHFCLGAALARLEGEVAIASLLRRCPDIALAAPAAEPHWRASVVRGLADLPVTFTPTT
jgi:cytochrome P450